MAAHSKHHQKSDCKIWMVNCTSPCIQPRLDTSDYAFFPYLKKELTREKHEYDKSLKIRVAQILKALEGNFYRDIEMSTIKCDKCLNFKGNYIKKN
ncbi:hypothetical protein PGB90_000996 [Kerria lacca]